MVAKVRMALGSTIPVIIHAGLPKTGTTYLQQRLVDNREWLASQGVRYPTIGQEIGPGHHNLARLFRGESVGAPWSKQTPREVMTASTLGVKPGEQLLLSSETFSSLHMQHAAALKDVVGSDVVYVLYLRRRSSMILSRWQEDVKHGDSRTFAEYVSAQLLGAGDVLRPEEPITVGARTFGVQALRLIIYEELVARRIDLFDHFVVNVLGLSLDGAIPAKEHATNTSLEAATVEALRALNAAQCKGQLWADGRHTYAQAALDYLRHEADGQALLADVSRVFDAHAESVDLTRLDQEWLSRDREIVSACGPQILNGSGDELLFPASESREARVLRPSVLHIHLPQIRFENASRVIVANAGI